MITELVLFAAAIVGLFWSIRSAMDSREKRRDREYFRQRFGGDQ